MNIENFSDTEFYHESSGSDDWDSSSSWIRVAHGIQAQLIGIAIGKIEQGGKNEI